MERLDALIAAARESGLTIDLLDGMTRGLSRQAFRRVMGNISALPSCMRDGGATHTPLSLQAVYRRTLVSREFDPASRPRMEEVPS